MEVVVIVHCFKEVKVMVRFVVLIPVLNDRYFSKMELANNVANMRRHRRMVNIVDQTSVRQIK